MNQQVFRTAAVKWVAARLPWNEKLLEAFKFTVNIRAWDQGSKSWWFPETFIPHVNSLLEQYVPGYIGSAQHQNIGDGRLEAGKLAPWQKQDHYAALCLTEDAPDGLIEVSYRYWRRQFIDTGAGPATPLLRVEEAYSQLTGKQP